MAESLLSPTQRPRSPSGVLVLDKPEGPTSHDIVARVRRTLKTREVGHAGTLDPMATGVLVIAVGEATKLVNYLTAADKSYEATIRLGVSTQSLDRLGAILETSSVSADWRSQVGDALEQEQLRKAQVPPVVSAIKIAGRAAHARVRDGETLVMEPRAVAVHQLEVLDTRVDPPELDVRLIVAKGYYVRALARDLAERLGTFGHLTALRRTRSGEFSVEEASREIDASRMLSLAEAARRCLPSVQLTDEGVFRAERGQQLVEGCFDGELHDELPARHAAWFAPDGRLVAVGLGGRVARGMCPHIPEP